MEAFSLLRYWRRNGSDGSSNANVSTSTTTTTIVTGVNSPASESEDEDDHGPFFDLEFSLPAEGDDGGTEELTKSDETENGSDYGEEDENEEDSDGSDELKFTVFSGSSGDSTGEVNVSVSPSDDLFFRGSFAPVDQTPEINSTLPVFRLSLKKSATKFRVMMLKFRKSKSKDESIECTNSIASISSNSKEEDKPAHIGETADSVKSMTVKLKRVNSSKASKKQQNDNEKVSGSSDDKKSPTETMQKYFRKVKPLYIRVSKKYGDKIKFTRQLTFPGANKPNSAPSAAAPPVTISSNHRDDSLVQQQDGIQSAILHCKRSFKSSRDFSCSPSLSSVPAPAPAIGQ